MSTGLLLFFLVSFAPLESDQSKWSSVLTKHLLTQHNKAAPPDGFVRVHHDVELVNILGVNEVAQTITVLLYTEEKWRDETLSWDPDAFGGVNSTWLPEDQVWLPDILIFNMLSHENLLHSVRAPVLIRSDGTVLFSHPAVYTVMCAIDISWFPLDEQHCGLEIASWEYGSSKLELIPGREHTLEHYHPNEEWKLLHVNITTTEYQHEDFLVSEIFFNIYLHRKPFFYMFSLVIPSYIITTLSTIGLFAPFSSTGERQEKFTLGLTAILTMAILSLMVSEKVPHTSKDIPLLVAYFMTDMVMITIATALTSLVLRIHRKGVRGDPPAPQWLIRILFASPHQTSAPDTNNYLSNGKIQMEGGESPTETQKMTMEMVENIGDVLKAIKNELMEIRMQQEGGGAVPRRFTQSHLVGSEPSWIQIAHNLDLLLMVLFLGFSTGITARMLILAQLRS